MPGEYSTPERILQQFVFRVSALFIFAGETPFP